MPKFTTVDRNFHFAGVKFPAGIGKKHRNFRCDVTFSVAKLSLPFKMLSSGGAANVDASQRRKVWFYFEHSHHSSAMPFFNLLNIIFPKLFHLFFHKFCQRTTCCVFSFQYCHITRTETFCCKNHWVKF